MLVHKEALADNDRRGTPEIILEPPVSEHILKAFPA